MTNKRIKSSCKVKMPKIVKPFRVSPLIKTTRWALLIYGIFHGSWKLNRLRVFEETEHVIRENRLREEHKRLMIENRKKSIVEIIELGKQFEVTEFPPGWDSEI